MLHNQISLQLYMTCFIILTDFSWFTSCYGVESNGASSGYLVGLTVCKVYYSKGLE